VACRSCGKSIEEGARFCRFCGKSQADSAAGSSSARSSVSGGPSAPSAHRTDSGLEHWLRQLFPRHHLQDEFTHVGTITAFFMAVIGFVLGLFTPALGGNWLSATFLLGSVALLLFLILRESTLSHIRVRNGGTPPSTESATRYHAGRRPSGTTGPAEAANAESSPPTGVRPPATPR
jgi:zinc-ribbon domain